METFFLVVLYVAFGAAVYIADIHIGSRIRRGSYSWTHKNPQKEEEVMGYIHGRPFERRFWTAVGLSLFDGVVKILWGGSGIPYEFGSLFWEIPLLLAGFYAGRPADKLLARRSEFYASMEQLEGGRVDVKEQLGNAGWSVYNFARELFRERRIVRPRVPEQGIEKPRGTLPNEEPTITDETRSEVESLREDGREIIRKYLKGGRR